MANLNDQPLIDVDITTLMPFLGQLSLGGFLGFATGYAIKKISKVLIIIIGVLFVLMQLAANQGYINIDWLKIQDTLNPFFEPNNINQGWRGLLDRLTADLPFAGGFVAMLIVGLKQG